MRQKFIPAVVILLISGLVTFYVYKNAWISEDAFITLRYVENILNGFGPVFNLGEKVQGYSHPLWFILITLLTLIFNDPILVSINSGLILTFFTSALIGSGFYRTSNNVLTTLCLLIIWGTLCISSNPWVSFQPGGLENALSHLLIVVVLIEITIHSVSRPGRLTLLMCLLCLSRPDLILMVIPLGFFVLYENFTKTDNLVRIFTATFPAIAWLLFAWSYYGDIIPNTAYAKVGIYANWQDSTTQGLAYLKDWSKYDTLAAGSTLIFFFYTFTKKQNKATYAVCLGIILYAVWIISIGGDFMRGRFFLPVFFSCIFLGLLNTIRQIEYKHFRFNRGIGVALTLFTILFLIQASTPNPGGEISGDGIVDERAFYPNYSLEYYIRHQRVDNPYLNLHFADELHSFADLCGPITIHANNPGTLGYLAGFKVSIIDLLGLTNRYIAKLPRETLEDSHPRPGHPVKNIPEEYLVSQQDLTIIPRWQVYIKSRDCSILEFYEFDK
jgi:arabinofuranosyltransferase